MVLFDWWAHSAGPSVMVLLQVRHTMGDGGSYVMGWNGGLPSLVTDDWENIGEMFKEMRKEKVNVPHEDSVERSGKGRDSNEGCEGDGG
jgi:hypothetical protein